MIDFGPKSLAGELYSVEFPRAGTGPHQQLTPCGSQPHPCSILSSRSDISALRPDKFSGLPPSKVSEVVSPLLSNPHPRRQQHSVMGHPAPLCPTLPPTQSLRSKGVYSSVATCYSPALPQAPRASTSAQVSQFQHPTSTGIISGGNEVVTSYQLSESLCTTRLY